MHSQPELVELAKEYGVGLQVDAQHLKDALCKLLRDPQERKRLGESGKKLIEESRGATQKTFDSLEQTRSIKKRKN
jgi:3-deoxy-D-manno-octulosonic-acid transferase